MLISNHSEYDDAYTKARLVGAKREVGEDNPFIVGAEGVQRYFTVMTECATASKLRTGASEFWQFVGWSFSHLFRPG